MITTIEPGRIYHVTGGDPDGIQNDLTAAVNALIEQGIKDGRHGIQVTRHDSAFFVVALNADVPYGLIREHATKTNRI